MKKRNFKELILSLVIFIVVAELIAVIAAFILGEGSMQATKNLISFFWVLAAIVSAIAWGISRSWGGSSAKSEKTFEKGLKENDFGQCLTFEGNDAFLAIDIEQGRIAYVSNSNAKEFQMAAAKDITKIVSDHIHSPLGGTSGVFFSFTYKGITTKMYTYLTNGNASLNSEKVQDAISKADYFADALNVAKNNCA